MQHVVKLIATKKTKNKFNKLYRDKKLKTNKAEIAMKIENVRLKTQFKIWIKLEFFTLVFEKQTSNVNFLWYLNYIIQLISNQIYELKLMNTFFFIQDIILLKIFQNRLIICIVRLIYKLDFENYILSNVSIWNTFK